MTDREKWCLRGPVKVCRRQWIFEGREFVYVDEFLKDGALLRQWHRNADQSEWTSSYEYNHRGQRLTWRIEDGIRPFEVRVYEYDSQERLTRIIARGKGGEERVAETYSYDKAGGKTKTLHVDLATQRPDTGYIWGVEGTDSSYSAPGTASVTTVYDERERPVGLLLRDIEGRLLSRVALLYDEAGNLIEEAQTNTELTFPQEWIKEMTPGQLDTMRALLGMGGEPMRQLHRYDEHGRKIETRSQSGPLGENRKTIAYNDHGDRAGETMESTHFERGFDEEGQFSDEPTSERVTRTEARFRYEYDERGNWVKKIVEGRSADEAFRESSVELRTLVYFEH